MNQQESTPKVEQEPQQLATPVNEEGMFLLRKQELLQAQRAGEVGVGKDDRAGSYVLRDEHADAVVGLQPNGSRYVYDGALLERGWEQYDTHQDASYFGTWVHLEKRLVFCYAEGDRSVVYCDSKEAFQRELQAMECCYGEPPPAFTTLCTETGLVTHYVQERPRV